MPNIVFVLFLIIIQFSSPNAYSQELYLKNNLQSAKVGDFIVTEQNKNYTLLLVDEIQPTHIAIEEITVPAGRIPTNNFSWKEWLSNDAPGNTCWVRYVINKSSGEMKEFFSYTKNGYYTIADSDNFLHTLLNVQLKKVPLEERKKVGPRPPSHARDARPYWQPKLVFEGKTVPNVAFNAWRTFWPKDGSDLSGKIIEIYIPENQGVYPDYFPYWLQVSGIVGKAKVHIIDSGKGAIGKYNR